ncbi:MAG TPA: hypothetical protein VHU22_23955 [Xanthobacteraceae bacterium]|jgi:hypothetical protein|nr:hypothetical protein [Xanthobacteraceae bacterium]
MNLDWLSWSNPLAIWWSSLTIVSALNVVLWFKLQAHSSKAMIRTSTGLLAIEPLMLLAAAYVFGCAFRSVLPRADVQRICLFDTWLSSVMIGRSVATVAELCFAAQWAIVLRELGKIAHSDTTKNIAGAVVPLIALAEACSWYAVISTNFLGNVLENSIWTVAFTLIGVALLRLLLSFRGAARLVIAAAAVGVACYVFFMLTVDVPMYFERWQADLADGKPLLGFFAGLHDLATRWVVTHRFAPWANEIAWMSLYFSVAVWMSLTLGGFGLVRHLVPRYRIRRPLIKATRRPVPIPIRSSERLY